MRRSRLLLRTLLSGPLAEAAASRMRAPRRDGENGGSRKAARGGRRSGEEVCIYGEGVGRGRGDPAASQGDGDVDATNQKQTPNTTATESRVNPPPLSISDTVVPDPSALNVNPKEGNTDNISTFQIRHPATFPLVPSVLLLHSATAAPLLALHKLQVRAVRRDITLGTCCPVARTCSARLPLSRPKSRRSWGCKGRAGGRAWSEGHCARVRQSAAGRR